MDAPDYTPPADDLGSTIHSGRDNIEITTNRADGSQTRESTDRRSLNYDSTTQYQDGSYDIDRVTGGQAYDQQTYTDPDGSQHSRARRRTRTGRPRTAT
jgi:hypothetical protein